MQKLGVGPWECVQFVVILRYMFLDVLFSVHVFCGLQILPTKPSTDRQRRPTGGLE